ncbi:SDR family NAD(P)-dependent oxidoreductase [Saccharopolyspora phatthalungensis]|uniref:3-oxoacyl-[acyl-carrier protein] reductase n=1 Tax=Saccharopolyspora phatthalungensis TaxID=664693 RepID=A0A840QCA4_9PSEU|nr:SDR family oxidoreductase [Saccharopolyspora phatthalungensis]MBB5158026.1 3-oxoacyl-[acyl-carrier protein] reductase [Saccharopolyspora phatthalungensis]
MTATTANDQTNPTRADASPISASYPELLGTVAVVTGAGRGMGAVFATELARRGINVVAGDLAGAPEVATQINDELAGAGRVAGRRADVTNPADHDALLRAGLDEFGRVDFWINNAGVFPQAEFTDIPPDQLTSTYQVNVNGVVYGAQTAARHMRANGGGAIVNMASVAGVRVRATRAAYNSSKAAVRHLTACMAVELGSDNIRVNAIAPGFVDTEMTRWVREDPAALDRALRTVPLHRVGAPIEVFGALYFLLSDSARYITGAVIPVDGGSQHV